MGRSVAVDHVQRLCEQLHFGREWDLQRNALRKSSGCDLLGLVRHQPYQPIERHLPPLVIRERIDGLYLRFWIRQCLGSAVGRATTNDDLRRLGERRGRIELLFGPVDALRHPSS